MKHWRFSAVKAVFLGNLFLNVIFWAPVVQAANPDCIKTLTKAHDHGDLRAYVSGMERSSLQKAALGSLGRPGMIADLGAGSGVSAYDLSVLFPDSTVVGVDLDPGMVQLAQSRYTNSNLSYHQGDAEGVNFKASSLDTIFMSSVLHHLTSYGTGLFDTQHVRNSIQSAHTQLKEGGVLIVRDFVVPDRAGDVLLEIPVEDGTALIFEKFVADFRSSTHPHSGVPFSEVPASSPGWRRFRLSMRDATEFILRKDYRSSYDAEIKEEYTYMTQKEFEQTYERAGFRILLSVPIFNPWIVKNRYEGKVRLMDLSGLAIPFPATNYIIAGEKVNSGAGVRLRETSRQRNVKPVFLRRRAVQDIKSQQIYDLVERPGDSVDLLPFFKRKDRVYVLSKQGYPRPISIVDSEQELESLHPRGYVIEPISFLVDGNDPLFVQIERQILKRAGFSANDLLNRPPQTLHRLYTSPGISDEESTLIAVQVKSRDVKLRSPGENYSGFSTSGVVRPIEATQVLRSAQVGALMDARLELGVYELLRSLKHDLGPWIGEAVTLKESSVVVRAKPAAAVLDPARKSRRYREVGAEQFGEFLSVRSSVFVEEDTQGRTLAQQTLEYVVPRRQSLNVVSTLPVFRRNGKIFVGLEHRHMPAVQMAEGFSDQLTVPAWRIPLEAQNLDQAKQFVQKMLLQEFKVAGGQVIELGGRYHPSKGLTPEVVHPLLIEVEAVGADSKLKWVELSDLLAQRTLIKNMHLMLSLQRATHALKAL